ncbi:MAG: alpha/beta hydrolase family protein [Ilumatobacteraceae bacterium]
MNLLLFPGAGSSSTHSSLLAIEKAVAPMPVTRADFPYRKAGRKAPDRTPVLLQAVRDEAAPLLAGGLVLGGRSMGGRMCSMVVADVDDPLPAVGLVLISYPLHPPGKPDSLRVEHLPRLTVPCLFIHGTRDAFGTPDQLLQWTATIPGKVTHHWIEGRAHDLKGCDAVIAATVATWISALG